MKSEKVPKKDVLFLLKEFFILENVKSKDTKHNTLYMSGVVIYLILFVYMAINQILETSFLVFSVYELEFIALYGLILLGLVSSLFYYNKSEIMMKKYSHIEVPIAILFLLILIVFFPFEMSHSGDLIPLFGGILNSIPNALLFIILIIYLIFTIFGFIISIWTYSAVKESMKHPAATAAKMAIFDSVIDEAEKKEDSWYQE